MALPVRLGRWIVHHPVRSATGREIGLYLHIGHLNHMKITDLDGDGIDEIILAGVNNDFNEACMLALDSRDIDGHGPVRSPYIPESFPPAREKAYVIIPRTIVGEAIRVSGTTMQARDVQILADSRRVKLDIQEYNESKEQASYSVLFDDRFNPVNYGTSGDFDELSKRLLREDRLTTESDAEYFRAFFKTFRYWDGDHWRSRPVYRTGEHGEKPLAAARGSL